MKVHHEGHSAAVCIPKEPGEKSGRERGWGVPSYVQGLLRNEWRAISGWSGEEIVPLFSVQRRLGQWAAHPVIPLGRGCVKRMFCPVRAIVGVVGTRKPTDRSLSALSAERPKSTETSGIHTFHTERVPK
jgi:hypothetical protein